MIQLPKKNDSLPDSPPPVRWVDVTPEEEGQRLDNYLLRLLNGVPKTRIYKAIRKGEVRVNKGRVHPDTRLDAGDRVRVPPFRETDRKTPAAASGRWIETLTRSIVLDEPDLLVINKPSGLAVHGGSGVDAGLIETLRMMYPDQKYLELVHRLDRDTSGLIMIARRASVLRDLHAQLRSDRIDKRYRALVSGKWPAHLSQVDAPLEKFALGSGERMVRVAAGGKRALTRFSVLRRWRGATLVEAKPVTGRTHQIRVHCRHAGHPILGDQKYTSPDADALAADVGVDRLFLHAASLTFRLGDQTWSLEAPLGEDLEAVLRRLDDRE